MGWMGGWPSARWSTRCRTRHARRSLNANTKRSDQRTGPRAGSLSEWTEVEAEFAVVRQLHAMEKRWARGAGDAARGVEHYGNQTAVGGVKGARRNLVNNLGMKLIHDSNALTFRGAVAYSVCAIVIGATNYRCETAP